MKTIWQILWNYKIRIGSLLLFYFGFFGMLAYGIYLCTDSSSIGWVCPGSTCNDDDSSSSNPTSTATNSWGPCGLGYTGSQEVVVESDATLAAISSPRPTQFPTVRPSSRAPTISQAPSVSPDSTCQAYCGNLNGVVCALRDYSCTSNLYVDDYYCGNATRQCTDPTALGLIISSAVILGITTLCLLGSACMYYAHWKIQNQFHTQFHRNFPPTTQPNPVWQMRDFDVNTINASSIDPEADPKAVASDIPVAKKTTSCTTDNLPVVELSNNVSNN